LLALYARCDLKLLLKNDSSLSVCGLTLISFGMEKYRSSRCSVRGLSSGSIIKDKFSSCLSNITSFFNNAPLVYALIGFQTIKKAQ